MSYLGIVVEESLVEKSILDHIIITNTEVEKTTSEHQTPWILQWTMHTVEVPDEAIERFVKQLSEALDPEHAWYADFKNTDTHTISYFVIRSLK